MEETFESIDRDTNEKVYYFIAVGLVAIHVVSYYYFLAFELIFAIFKTLTFSADDLNEWEKVFLNMHSAITIFGVGGMAIASFIFGFFDKLRTLGTIIMIFVTGFCNLFLFSVMGKKSGGELALFVVGASVMVLIFIVLYFRERKRKLAVMKTSNSL
jgi:hypothetical protein